MMQRDGDNESDLQAQYRQLLRRIEANESEFLRLGRSVWRVQEDERRRLARELHDGIGQNLTALKHRLALVGSSLGPDDDALRSRLEAAIALCSVTLEDTRNLSRMLRPPILDDLGLEQALRWLARSMAEAGGPQTAVEIESLPALDGDQQTLLFRVAQEALNNVAKHARARNATVRLRSHGGQLQLQVEDDGCGCDADSAARSGGSGLGGMRERLRLYGGRFQLQSTPGDGTRVLVSLPLDSV